MPNEGPNKNFTVHLDLLHQLARTVALQDTALNNYDLPRLEYPAAADTEMTHSSNSSQV